MSPDLDHRRMREESGFALLDEHIGSLVRQQEADIVRELKRQQHERIRAALQAIKEQPCTA